MYQRILVPLENSKADMAILDHVITLATHDSASVVLIHVADGFAARFATLDSATLKSTSRVISKKGESMSSIARKHQLTAKQLNWYNPQASRLKSGNLAPGQAITVPAAAVVAAARDVPNPSIERYPRRARARPAANPPKGAVAKPSATSATKVAPKSSAKAPAKPNR